MNCHCGRNVPFSVCCLPKHVDITKALTAEDLMRSRYSAFVEANGAYLMKSWHPKEARKQNQTEIEEWAKSVNWLKLEVLAKEKGQPEDAEGVVEFKAFFVDAGKMDVIHEISTFKKYNNHWVYVKAKN